MSCVTWLGRLATRFFVSGIHPPGEHYLAAVIPAERFLRRHISTGIRRSSHQDLADVASSSSAEAIARETRAELVKQVCL